MLLMTSSSSEYCMKLLAFMGSMREPVEIHFGSFSMEFHGAIIAIDVYFMYFRLQYAFIIILYSVAQRVPHFSPNRNFNFHPSALGKRRLNQINTVFFERSKNAKKTAWASVNIYVYRR